MIAYDEPGLLVGFKKCKLQGLPQWYYSLYRGYGVHYSLSMQRRQYL